MALRLSARRRFMRYPMAIEPGDAKQAYSVMMRDLPGRLSAGDTWLARSAKPQESLNALRDPPKGEIRGRNGPM